MSLDVSGRGSPVFAVTLDEHGSPGFDSFTMRALEHLEHRLCSLGHPVGQRRAQRVVGCVSIDESSQSRRREVDRLAGNKQPERLGRIGQVPQSRARAASGKGVLSWDELQNLTTVLVPTERLWRVNAVGPQ